MKARLRLRAVGMRLIARFGALIVDQRTGAPVGRALIIPWGGKIHLIGLETPVRAIWLPQKRLTYWKQELGFTTHPPPDFARVRGERD